MILLGSWFLGVLPSYAWGGETMVFTSEDKKLEFIKKKMVKEKHRRLVSFGVSNCEEMMDDFLAGKNFRAIEPKVRVNSIDDSRLKKWKQCDDGEKGNYGGLEYLGGPPYRYYQIELDNNTKNGPEDMIYYEYSDKYYGMITGYDWVDLKECEIMGGFQVSIWPPEQDQISLNALAYYKNEFWVVDYKSGSYFRLVTRIGKGEQGTCSWALFQD